MSTALKERLDTIERNKLRKLEATVAEGIASFVVVGEALKEIRDAKLYRESHKTFEKYVDDKWGIERRRAYQLIDASEASKKLCTSGTQNERVNEIKTERHLRELKDVPADAMQAVVNKAADIAGDELITASDIKQAREEVLVQDTKPSHTKDVWEDVVDDQEPEADETPEALKPVDWFKEQLKLINELKRNLNAVLEVPGTELIVGRQRVLLREIENVKGGFVAACPHAICPRCGGKTCSQCGNMGWVNKQRFDELGAN